MGSTRLPGKVLKPILGMPMLALLLDRVKSVKELDCIVVATTFNELDDAIVATSNGIQGVIIFRGPEEDVLARYFAAAKLVEADVILRATADNPMFDAQVASELIAVVTEGKADYASNNLDRSYPYGLDLEVFTSRCLSQAHRHASEPYEREHVTPYIRANPHDFRLFNLKYERDCSSLRLSVDTAADYAHVKTIFERFGSAVRFTDLI
jgi:spore coat polysaccharide biosynthesis protein SpsF